MQDEKKVVHRDGTDVVDVVEIQDTSRDHVEILKIRVEKIELQKQKNKNRKNKKSKNNNTARHARATIVIEISCKKIFNK